MSYAQTSDPGATRWVIMIGACLGVFSLTMNGTALITAVPAIRHEFDISPTTIQWIVTIYFLTGAIFLAAAGRIGDFFGHGRVFLAGALCFMLAYVMIAIAGNAATVLVGRAIQGVAGALLLPMSLALIKATFPEQQRQVAAGIWSGFLGLGLGIGPIVGGLLTHYVDWRSVFWVSLAISAVSFGIVLFALRGRFEQRAERKQGRRDYLGFILLAVAMGAFTFAITHAQHLGWQSAITLSAMVIAIASFLVLLVRERRVDRPFLDLKLFKHRHFVAATLGILCTFFLIYGILYFASIFVQNPLTFGDTAAEAGLTLIALTIVMFVVSLVVHRAMLRWGPCIVVTTGMALICLGALLLYVEVASDSIVGLEVALILCGVGLGLTVPVFSGIGLATLHPDQTGQGAGLLTTFTFLGATIGVSTGGLISSSAAQSTLVEGLAALPASQPAAISDIEAGLHASADQLQSLLGQFDASTASSVQSALRHAVDAGFAGLTLLCVVVAAFGTIVQFLLLRR